MSRTSDRPWLTPRETAKALGVSLSCLRKWRGQGKGPAWRRLSYRTIRYDASTLES